MNKSRSKPNYQPQYNYANQFTTDFPSECLSKIYLTHAGIPVSINDEGIPIEDGINPILGNSQSNKFKKVIGMGVYLLHKDADCAYPYIYIDKVYYRRNREHIKEKLNPLNVSAENVAKYNISVYRLRRITKNTQFKRFMRGITKNNQFNKPNGHRNSSKYPKRSLNRYTN